MHQPLADLRRTALVGLADVSLEVLVVLKREHVFSSSARNEFDQTVAQGEVSHEPTSADEIPVERTCLKQWLPVDDHPRDVPVRRHESVGLVRVLELKLEEMNRTQNSTVVSTAHSK